MRMQARKTSLDTLSPDLSTSRNWLEWPVGALAKESLRYLVTPYEIHRRLKAGFFTTPAMELRDTLMRTFSAISRVTTVSVIPVIVP